MMIDEAKVNELIKLYKNRLINSGGLKGCDELYKWELLGKYRGKPNVDAEDLEQEFENITFKNLVYKMAVPVMRRLAKNTQEEYRDILRSLFDEKQDLTQRIELFVSNTVQLFRSIETNNHYTSHHDERTASSFLTYHNPDKYTFYKPSLYKTACVLCNLEAKKKGRYQHYLEIMGEVSEIMKRDYELMELISTETKELKQ